MGEKRFLLAFIVLTFFGFNTISFGQTNVGGNITVDTKWTKSGSPYILTSNVGVPTGINLTIEPGVEVKGGGDLLVKGSISIEGSANEMIIWNNCRLFFKNANLSLSSFEYVSFINGSKLQIGDVNGQNSNSLKIINSSFQTGSEIDFLRLDDVNTNSSIAIENTSIDSCLMNVYQEDVIFKNCQVINTSIHAYITFMMNNCQIDKVRMEVYNLRKDIEISNSSVVNCSFTSLFHHFAGLKFNKTRIFKADFGSMRLDINKSFLLHSPFRFLDIPYLVNIDSSIIYYDGNIFEKKIEFEFDTLIQEFGLDPEYLNITNSQIVGVGGDALLGKINDFDPNREGRCSVRNSTFNNCDNVLVVKRTTVYTELINCNFSNAKHIIRNGSKSNIQATHNWWGTSDESIIEQKIYDEFDNLNYGQVDYSNYLTEPSTTAPISVPISIIKGKVKNGVAVTWKPNPESDVAGYKVFYNPTSEFEFSDSLVVIGGKTSAVISGVSLEYRIVVAAFDKDADNFEDLYEGHQSWYSQDAVALLSATASNNNPVCEGSQYSVSVTSDHSFSVDNKFILQLSDVNGSFENAINLDTITFVSEQFTAELPDTLQSDKTYLNRVFSTEYNIGSETFEVSFIKSPLASFSISDTVCSRVATIEFTGQAPSNATFEWDLAGGTMFSGSGKGPLEVGWSSVGNKTITLTVADQGCSSSSSKVVYVKETPSSSFSIQSSICKGGVALVTYEGEVFDSSTYDWHFDGGNIISGSGAGPYEISWDTYGTKNITLSVTNNGCTAQVTSKTLDFDIAPTISFEMQNTVCFDQELDIRFTGDDFTETVWDFDGGVIVSGDGSGPYKVKWNTSGTKNISFQATNIGCSKDTTISVVVLDELLKPSLCLVTVDPALAKNKVVWNYPFANASKFGIYKESDIAGVFDLIGYVDADSTSSFVDTESNPLRKSDKYTISALDDCGVETIQSEFHKTIHLTINKGLNQSYNLIWDEYVGFLVFNTYRIYRSLDGGDFELLAKISSNLTSYTDLEVPSDNVEYQIEVVNPQNCGGLFRRDEDDVELYNSTRSNVARSESYVTSVNMVDPLDEILIRPNPFSTYIQVESNRQIMSYEIISLSGEVIQSRKRLEVIKGKIELKGFVSGVYFFKAVTGNGVVIEKIIRK